LTFVIRQAIVLAEPQRRGSAGVEAMRNLSALMAIAALCPVLAACNEATAPAATSDAARPVMVRTVAFEDRVPVRRLVATIRPRVEAELGFRIPGKVLARLVDVGDRVAAGQALARLDETDVELQREQALAERNAAAASLDQAQGDLRRTTTLAGQGWTAASAADRQKATTEEARGRLLRAERALTLAENASAYAVLAADADGVVMAAPIEPGQVVTAGQLAVRLAHTAEKEAEVAVPEAMVERVRRGRASLTLWSDPRHAYGATLREFAPVADGATRTFRARFSLPDASPAVELGMTATLSIAERTSGRIARLPLSALFDQGGGPSVWIAAHDGGLTLKPVDVEGYEARDVLIAGGVSDGDAVVTLGVQKLDPGQKVRVVQALQF